MVVKSCAKRGLRVVRAGAASGFTLIEVLLVIVIILMLAGALVVYVLPQQKGAEKNTTKLLLQQVIKDYPNTSSARLARSNLLQIK